MDIIIYDLLSSHYYYDIVNAFTIQADNNIHIKFMFSPPCWIAHRNRLQCGVGTKNGDIKNPVIVSGTQK